MTTQCSRFFIVLSLAGLAVVAAGCGGGVVTRINPEQVTGGKPATVVVKLSGGGRLPDEVMPTLQIVDGEECGTVGPTQKRDEGRWASGTFNASADVENCVVTIRGTVGTQSATTRATVNRFDPRVRIDGVSAIAAILIASFAIDRVTAGILGLIAFVRGRRPQWFPARARDFADVVASGDRNQRVPYFVIAGVLGAVVLGWFGEVRVLAALGFASVNPYLDALITGLVLMIGADRASDLLQKLDVPGAAAAKKPSAPIEVTGKLVLENPEPQPRAGDPMRLV